MATTIREAKAIARGYGMTFRKVAGEYRVNYAGGTEGTAYYGTDIADALGTAWRMAVARLAAPRICSNTLVRYELVSNADVL